MECERYVTRACHREIWHESEGAEPKIRWMVGRRGLTGVPHAHATSGSGHAGHGQDRGSGTTQYDAADAQLVDPSEYALNGELFKLWKCILSDAFINILPW